ncbi:hypothetical protein MRB53_040217 [Persea americana]|nr:hypothetical protein MRB53_040217 [Persea americana]
MVEAFIIAAPADENRRSAIVIAASAVSGKCSLASIMSIVSKSVGLGGARLSKLSLRLAEAPGVLVHAPCAGEGVTLTKSAKLKFVPGVVGPKPRKP